MQIIPIKLFTDNYSYAVFSESSSNYYLIDPADYKAVSSFISSSILSNYTLSGVFSTHKHGDHSGNNQEISNLHPNLMIIGGEQDNIPACNRPVKDNEKVILSDNIEVICIHAPCHTRGHMLYYFKKHNHHVLFTGDTLLVGGCGRFFEGDAEEMMKNFERIKSLPLDCEIYCGHEYTVANFEWACKVDVEYQAMANRLNWARDRVRRGLPTVPSTVEDEINTNIFMRAGVLKDVLGCQDPVTALAVLRNWKNIGKTLI